MLSFLFVALGLLFLLSVRLWVVFWLDDDLGKLCCAFVPVFTLNSE